MESTVNIKDYGSTIISVESAQQIANTALEFIRHGDSINLDFKDVLMITTQCANVIISSIMQETGKDFRSRVLFTNISANMQYIISDTIAFCSKKIESV